MGSLLYNNYVNNIPLNTINLITDDIRCVLMNDTYTPDINSDLTYSNITSGEIAATGGYGLSGISLTGKSISADSVNNRSVLIADKVSWGSSTSMTARSAVLFKAGSTPELSPLVCYIDFAVNRSSSLDVFEIEWDNNDGILAYKQTS